MMDIYIPDIKLPKDEPGAFKVIVIYVDTDRKLRAGCEGTHEVTAVPPHGRLIDADAPISLVDTRGEKVEVTVAHIIEKNRGIVKAVIPASEEGET